MKRLALRMRLTVWAAGLSALTALVATAAQAQTCSAWLIESSRFMKVPFGVVHAGPCLRAWQQQSDEQHSSTVDLPVNIGVIKCGNDLILYDTGWKQQEYLKMTGSDHWAPIGEQLKVLGFNAADVTKVVIGHAHWDHAGQLSDLPNAVLYVQREELRGDRVGAELSRNAHQGDQFRSGRLQPHASLRLHAADHGGGLRQGS